MEENYNFLPLISVIIPVFNMQAYISDALTSVFHQTYKNIEIIVVDDGSTDATAEIIKKLMGQNNIQYFYQQNKGPSSARNMGIQHSKGEFLAFLDGDDYWEPSKLEKQEQILETMPDVDVVYCKYHKVDSTCNALFDYEQPTPPPVDLYKALLFANIIYGSCSAVVVRANALNKVGNFDEELYIGEDLELWQRLAVQHKFYCIDEYLVYIRTHDKSAQAKEDYFEKGQLLFLNKLKTRIPEEYNTFWPEIVYSCYYKFFTLYFMQSNYRKSIKYANLIFHLGVIYSARFLERIAKSAIKKVVRKTIYSIPILGSIYVFLLHRKNINDWKRKGKPIPAPPDVKQRIVSSFLKKYKVKTFIETGTFLGDMVEAMLYDASQIYSIELSNQLYTNASHKFFGVKNVKLLQGDSGEILKELIPTINEPCLFWLDAYYSEGVTAHGDKETPVMEELEAISLHSWKAVDIILIDDARGFGKGDHPPLSWVREWAKNQGFNYFSVDCDIITILNERT